MRRTSLYPISLQGSYEGDQDNPTQNSRREHMWQCLRAFVPDRLAGVFERRSAPTQTATNRDVSRRGMQFRWPIRRRSLLNEHAIKWASPILCTVLPSHTQNRSLDVFSVCYPAANYSSTQLPVRGSCSLPASVPLALFAAPTLALRL